MGVKCQKKDIPLTISTHQNEKIALKILIKSDLTCGERGIRTPGGVTLNSEAVATALASR